VGADVPGTVVPRVCRLISGPGFLAVGSTSATQVSSSLRYRFGTGIGWNLVGTAFLQGSVFLGNIIVARLLGAEVFGVYNIVLSTLLTASGLAQFSTGITATRYVAQYRAKDKEKVAGILCFLLRLSFISGCLGTVLVALASNWLADNVLGRTGIAEYFVVSAAYILFSVMSGYLTGALAGLEGYRSLALISPIQGVLHITLLGVGAWVWGGYGAVIGLTLSSALRWILLRWVLLREADKHQIPWRGAKGRNEHNMLTRFSIPASLAGLSSMPALWLSNVFLIQQPGGYKEMGLYGAAFSLRTLIIIFPVILNNVTSSILNFQLGVGNDERYRKLFKANLLISVFIAILGMAVIIISGRWILGLFGAEFQAGYPILFLLVLSTVPETLQNAIYQVIQSRGRMWLSLYGVAIPRDVTLIGMAYYFTRDYGASGLATAYTIAWTIALLCTIVIVWNLGIVRRSRRRGQE